MVGEGGVQACKTQQDPVLLLLCRTKAPYEYMSDADPKKQRVNHRGPGGKVITENANILISTSSKIDYLKNK